MERLLLELKSKFSLPGGRKETLEIVGAMEIEEEDLEIEGVGDIKAEMMTGIDLVDQEHALIAASKVT
jgi:hypothetical protein